MERIQLRNTVFEGRNNVYVLPSGSGVTLVDAGVATTATREQLRAGLEGMGYGFADVERVLLTHWHADHAGLAGEIQAESGATVYAHEADAELLDGGDDARERYNALARRAFDAWRLPDEKQRALTAFVDAHDGLRGDPVEVTPLSDGDAVGVGERTLETVHLPGHTAGLCAFAFDGERGREAFVGDVVLPKYTPNVGGADLRVDDPLSTYVDSLADVVDADYGRVWPGHRDVVDEPTERARVIHEHHVERTRRVVDVLADEGPCDVWTTAAHLFGELEGIHILHGPGEAFAHLAHLESAGVVERDGADYALVDDTPDVASLFRTVG